MIKFKSLPFRYLHDAAHHNYCTNVSEALADAPPELLAALGTLPTEFNKWLEAETALIDWVRKSVLTENIAEASRRMDRALVALKLQVRALHSALLWISPMRLAGCTSC
jgi:hypothetical protein